MAPPLVGAKLAAVPYFDELHDPSSVPLPRACAPHLALLIYGNGHFILKHPVLEQDGEFVLGAGVILTPEDMDAMAKVLAGQGMQLTGPATLAVGIQSVAWWVPPSQRPLLFDAKYDQTKSVAKLSGVPVPLPGLVMIASPNSLKVFAVLGSARPTGESTLYHAPFWNMFSSGEMCRGTVKYPSSCTPESQSEWETCFFQSVFTGPSRTDKYMHWGKSYEELLQAAIKQGAFPEDTLMPLGETLGAKLGLTQPIMP